MLHEPAAQTGPDSAAGYKMRLGVWMFVFYSIFYAGFVFINLYDPLLMEAIIVFGLNLATVYGFLLIVGALLLAVIYDVLCRVREQAPPPASEANAQPEGPGK